MLPREAELLTMLADAFYVNAQSHKAGEALAD